MLIFRQRIKLQYVSGYMSQIILGIISKTILEIALGFHLKNMNFKLKQKINYNIMIPNNFHAGTDVIHHIRSSVTIYCAMKSNGENIKHLKNYEF